jgi:hypothetical protein
MPSVPARIFAYLFVRLLCVAGPFFLLIAAITGLERARFVHSSLRAKGVVVDLHSISVANRPNSWACAPIFRFTAKDGRSYTVTSHTGSLHTLRLCTFSPQAARETSGRLIG